MLFYRGVQKCSVMCPSEKLSCFAPLVYIVTKRIVHFGAVLETVCCYIMYGMYVCMVITYSRVWISRVRLPILLVVSLTGKMNIPLSPYVPESLVSRDGFSRPVPRQPAHPHTQAESGAYSRDSSRFPRRRPFIYLNRHTPPGQSRGYRVTQLCTDSVHCRESAGTGPVVPKVVPVTGAAILQVIMDQ